MIFFSNSQRCPFEHNGLKIFFVFLICFVYYLIFPNLTYSFSDHPDASKTKAADVFSDKITGVTVGIEGVWKNGFWTPITVKTTGKTGGELEIIAEDSDGVPTRTRQKHLNNAQTICVPLGRAKGSLEFRLYNEKGELTDRKDLTPPDRKFHWNEKNRPEFLYQIPENTSRPIYLIVGNENIGLHEAVSELLLKEENRPLLLRIKDFSELPDRWYGLEAVERIILASTDLNCLKGITKDHSQIQAIHEWTQKGGRLIILAGKDSLPLFRDNGPFVPFLPEKFNDSPQEIRMANELRAFIPKAKNLVMNGSLDAPYLYVPRLSKIPDDIKIDIIEGETPLLFRRASGFGSITFFCADLSELPISRWSARPKLVLGIFGFETGKKMEKSTSNMLVQRGYQDLSGQLRSVLDSFKDIRNIPFSLILTIAFVYILVLGPGDWYLTHKLIKRPGVTWITLPLYIILFCALTVYIGHSGRKADLRVNQAELVDIDAVTGSVRGTSWFGFYSPRDEKFDFRLMTGSLVSNSKNKDKTAPGSSKMKNNVQTNVSAKTDTEANRAKDPDSAIPAEIKFEYKQTLFSWLGLQGDGLGGMSPKTQTFDFWKDPYSLTENSRELTGLPVKVRSSKSLFGRWFGQIDPLTQHDITDHDGMPAGEIVNPFGVSVKNAVLLYGRWAINLGELLPGKNKIVTGDTYGSSSDRKSHKTLRKELRHIIGTTEDPFNERAGSSTQTGLVRYNSQSSNIPYILRTMMFYQLAGGNETIGLDNSYHQYLDAGDLILDGRAVLIGTIDDRNAFPLQTTLTTLDKNGTAKPFGSADETNGPENHVIVLRMFFPVKKSK